MTRSARPVAPRGRPSLDRPVKRVGWMTTLWWQDGSLTSEIADTYLTQQRGRGAGGSIVGIDINPASVAYATERRAATPNVFRSTNKTLVNFHCADATALPESFTRSFDVVTR